MIAIVNIGPTPGNQRRGKTKRLPKDTLGPHRYELRINSELVTTFTHTRGDSLATCLRKAAEAAEWAHKLKLSALVQQCTAAASR